MNRGIREEKSGKKFKAAEKLAKLFSHDGKDNGTEPQTRKAYARRRIPALIPLVLIPLLFCFAMISPLSSCVIGSRDYIGTAAAASIALEDSGISPSSAEDMQADMIMLDGEAYYKVQFNGTVTEYRYIIDATSGDIIMQTFKHIDTDD